MLFFIHNVDKPNSIELRMATRPKHLKYLEPHRSKFVIGGPSLTEDGQTMTGSIMIIDVADRAAAEEFVRNDPYTKAGLFEQTVVRPFKKVLP